MRLLGLLVALMLPACSGISVDYELCTADSQCSAAFGRGWSCEMDTGHCMEAAPLDRCSSEPPGILDNPEEHADRMLLGSVFQHGPIFSGMVRSARLAVIQVNDRGGVHGTPVGILECSSDPADLSGDAFADGLDPEAATVAAGEWLSDVWGVSTIIGPATSGRTLLAHNSWSTRDTLLISPSATSPELTAADGLESTYESPGLLWRTAPPDSFQGAVLAALAIDDGNTDVGIIAQSGAYGEGLADVFAAEFDGEGRTSAKYPFESETDLSLAITNATGADHDAVLVVSSDTNDIIRFFNSAEAVPGEGFSNTRILLPDGAFSDALLDDQDGVVEDARDLLFPNVRGTVPGLPAGPAFINFTAQYASNWPDIDPTTEPFTAQAYDAAWLALAGHAWADANEDDAGGTNVARGLRQVSDSSFGTPLEIGPGAWTAIEANFEAGEAINVQGASGPLDFGSDGETVAPLDVWDLDEDGGDWTLHRWCCIDVASPPTEGCVPSLDACEDHDER